MNAVNLIPGDSRSRRFALPTSPPTLGLFGGLVLVLIAAVLYVSAVNQVTARKSELAHVTAGAASWTAAANAYAPFVQAAQHHTAELADVRQLAAGRFPWQQLLSQIGGLMPAAAALSSMQATTTPGSTPTAPPTPTVQLSGCAATQSAVAQTMVQLHRVNGVTAVSLSSSSDSGASAGSGSSTSASSQSGGCPFRVIFQVSLTFGTTSAAAAATAGSATTASATTTPATGSTAPASTTPATAAATTPATATATTPATGRAQ
jgi:hypothetical protein